MCFTETGCLVSGVSEQFGQGARGEFCVWYAASVAQDTRLIGIETEHHRVATGDAHGRLANCLIVDDARFQAATMTIGDGKGCVKTVGGAPKEI